MTTIYVFAAIALTFTFAAILGPLFKIRSIRQEAESLGACGQPPGGLNLDSIAQLHSKMPTEKTEALLALAREVYPTYVFRMRVFTVVFIASAGVILLGW